MAISQIHTRSISLPSRLHPIINSTEFEAQLDKLKSTVSLTSVDTIISGLVGLADLYNSMDTQAPSSLEEALERSVELLDCCASIKEVAQMTRDSARALQSALRRKGSDSSSSLRNDVASYVASRKRMRKCITKSLKALKSWEGASDVYGLTATVFRSAMLFFSSSSSSSSSSWNRVARAVLMSKSAARRGGVVVNEVGCVDLALSSGEFDKKMVQRSLEKLDSCVDGIEEGLERVFRELVRSRVSLLNILTNH